MGDQWYPHHPPPHPRIQKLYIRSVHHPCRTTTLDFIRCAVMYTYILCRFCYSIVKSTGNELLPTISAWFIERTKLENRPFGIAIWHYPIIAATASNSYKYIPKVPQNMFFTKTVYFPCKYNSKRSENCFQQFSFQQSLDAFIKRLFV